MKTPPDIKAAVMQKEFFMKSCNLINRYSFLTGLFLLLLFSPAAASAVEKENDPQGWGREYTNFLTSAVNHDFSEVFIYEPAKYKPTVLGFIGTDMQRFYIHFNSINRNPDNPYQYLVKGKTRVKNNICSFEGKITIVKAGLLTKNPEDDEFPDYQEGFVLAEMELLEEKSQPGSGVLKGMMQSDFLIDQKGQLAYNDLMAAGDGFYNNQFTGDWTSYKTGKAKICNFGDDRIPSGNLPKGTEYDLDQGAGSFIPSAKYLGRGWQTHFDCIVAQDEKACREENKQWWK